MDDYERGRQDGKIETQMSGEELVGKLDQARKDERERIIKELAGLVDLRNKPETLCVKFLDWLESELQALKG